MISIFDTGNCQHFPQQKTPKRLALGFFVLIECGSFLLSQSVTRLVPSAFKGLTSVFEMRTGGSPQLSPPQIVYILFGLIAHIYLYNLLMIFRLFPLSFRLLGFCPVSFSYDIFVFRHIYHMLYRNSLHILCDNILIYFRIFCKFFLRIGNCITIILYIYIQFLSKRKAYNLC